MKKLLAMLLALSVSCAVLASCGEEDSSSKKDKDTSSVADSKDDASSDAADDSSSADDDSSNATDGSSDASSDDGSSDAEGGNNEDTLFGKLMSDIKANNSFTLGMDIEGQSIYITTDGTSIYEDISISLFGMQMVGLITPDATYGIDKEGKRYYKEEMEAEEFDLDELLSEFAELGNMEYVSTSTDTIEGAEYTIEVYNDVDEYGDTNEIKFAFNDKGEMCYAYEDGMYIPYIFTATADTSKFSLDGYTEMTEDEYTEFVFGDMSFDFE